MCKLIKNKLTLWRSDSFKFGGQIKVGKFKVKENRIRKNKLKNFYIKANIKRWLFYMLHLMMTPHIRAFHPFSYSWLTFVIILKCLNKNHQTEADHHSLITTC